ncbi:hypothetical protein JTE90_021446 [Oedothorax gibbosus]|uniref:Uncharacterized protein n=1 Tax=Oedothorax gibbosus TaxID=931172 RepID=A0AAV6VVM3_9ARAC|nr:hypothetical protein JTE90_021446 [Oedothorax gibbosus]
MNYPIETGDSLRSSDPGLFYAREIYLEDKKEQSFHPTTPPTLILVVTSDFIGLILERTALELFGDSRNVYAFEVQRYSWEFLCGGTFRRRVGD